MTAQSTWIFPPIRQNSDHYHSRRKWRPRHAYVFGFIEQVCRLASLVPGAVNAFTQTPGLKSLAKFAGGIDQKRALPNNALIP